MSIGSIFSKAAKWFSNFFKSHQTQIQEVLSDAKIAASTAAAIATVAGENDAAKLIGKVSDGLIVLGVAAGNAASDQNLAAHAANIADAVNTLVQHGDVGVKNQEVKDSIADVASKAVSVVQVVQSVTGV